MSFTQKIEKAQEKNKSLLCVGLDPDFDKMPERFQKTLHPQFTFNKWIIDQTHDLVSAYKPNTAFYEAQGTEGIIGLKATCDYIREKRPHIPIILDFKRADIGNTNNGYVQFAFDYLSADAVTVNPYLGQEAVQPFLNQKSKGVFILCKTSNPGSGEFQDVIMSNTSRLNLEVDTKIQEIQGLTLSEYVAHRVKNHWNKNKNCMLVVGASYPNQLNRIRKIVGNMIILVPGIGAQAGDLEKTIKSGIDTDKKGLIINVSRSILFSNNPRKEAKRVKDAINSLC